MSVFEYFYTRRVLYIDLFSFTVQKIFEKNDEKELALYDFPDGVKSFVMTSSSSLATEKYNFEKLIKS